MRIVLAILLVVALGAVVDPTASPRYFHRVRDVQVAASDRQNYFVVDAEMWAHARPDLADLRIYSGDTQVPYALAAQASWSASEQRDARILNLGAAHGATEFDLDMEGFAEYDRVQLRLSARDFVASAKVDGQEMLAENTHTHLGTSTLYDFSRERLGSSFVLHLPASTFRYLHVSIRGGVEPQQVLSAQVSYLRESKAVWASAGSCGPAEQKGRDTVVTCTLLPGAPLGRLAFGVAPDLYNFRRTVTIAGENGVDLQRASISRIRMEKARPPVVAEELTPRVPCTCKPDLTILRIAIDNGDDPPLSGLRIEPQALERRVYFDGQGPESLRLYYGDDKLGPPVYDYAKFFRQSDDAARAQLGADTPNPAYERRPDGRPWSERHPMVLWAAMLAAVVVLAGLAIREMMSVSSPERS
jgi:hypothetical protein